MTQALATSLPAPRRDAPAPPLRAEWARCLADVRAAQRLRYRVFVEEGGAQVTSATQHHELDAFDPWCEHLLVRDPTDGRVIGTYRVLTPEKARLQGGLYADAEFDLAPLLALRPRLVELGRACVHPDHRAGGVILALWRGLTRFMLARGLDTMIGAASVPMRDGGHAAASLWTRLRETHLAPPALRVQPRLPLPVERLDCCLAVEPPPLVKGYLRLGARLLGAPAWDPAFQTADLPMLVRLSEMPARYRRHFLADAATRA
ncbi:MAG TPA: GNAT family N-acyltransferase [Burkholderiaceae bacterium]|nr:GNAT family N-acyltransferase [Burkholderiaceae bacterium]